MLARVGLRIVAVCLVVMMCSLDQCRSDSPTEEMQKFIDECNVMMDTMATCEDGWVTLEKNIIVSVDSFADRILSTEQLILDEADEILVMADRIVATEQLVKDLGESCSCDANHLSTAFGSPKNPMGGRLSSTMDVETDTSNADRAAGAAVDHNVAGKLETAVVQFDHCSAMDQVIKVMDASITMLAEFNTEFLELLNYLLDGIDRMGDQIVYTECLIIDMSQQVSSVSSANR
jgi:hypothetical protein